MWKQRLRELGDLPLVTWQDPDLGSRTPESIPFTRSLGWDWRKEMASKAQRRCSWPQSRVRRKPLWQSHCRVGLELSVWQDSPSPSFISQLLWDELTSSLASCKPAKQLSCPQMSGSDCSQVPQGLRSIQLAWGSVPHLPETAGGRGV